MSMKDVPRDFSRALDRYASEIDRAVSKVAAAREGRDYASAAFRGGDRSCFRTEDAISAHYGAVESEARQRGAEAMERLLRDMREAVDCGLRVDTAKAAEAAGAVALLRDDAAVVRFASEPERRDDYTYLASVARRVGSGEKSVAAARRIGQSLDAYEHSLSEVQRKAERFITKALAGDAVCRDGWRDWVVGAVDACEGSYEALQGAVMGEECRNDVVASLAALLAR